MTNLLDKQAPSLETLLTPETAMPPLERLLQYVRNQNYEGWDLFDGLNSRLFKCSPFYKSRLFRLALIQFCKKSPANLRHLLLVPKGFNPKGGALFLMGHLNLLRFTGDEAHADAAEMLAKRLKETAIRRPSGIGWGYNFDWQARAFYVPVGEPNLVTSVYVGQALLEYHRRFDDAEALALALEVSDFILNEMVKFENDVQLCFNYIPGKDAEVHNANLLGAGYLAQTLAFMPENRQDEVRNKILKSVRFSIADINPDGSWPYGTKPFHRWVDNFHTAYNIECLLRIGTHLQTDAFAPVLTQAVDYWLARLFTEDGLPKYFNTKLYPIDVHVIAETMVLLNMLRDYQVPFNQTRAREIEAALLELTGNFQDAKGYFYYQQTARGFNKIPYIRWSQAWMFYALSSCL